MVEDGLGILNNSVGYITHKSSFNADENTEQRCHRGGYIRHPGLEVGLHIENIIDISSSSVGACR